MHEDSDLCRIRVSGGEMVERGEDLSRNCGNFKQPCKNYGTEETLWDVGKGIVGTRP